MSKKVSSESVVKVNIVQVDWTDGGLEETSNS